MVLPLARKCARPFRPSDLEVRAQAGLSKCCFLLHETRLRILDLFPDSVLLMNTKNIHPAMD